MVKYKLIAITFTNGGGTRQWKYATGIEYSSVGSEGLVTILTANKTWTFSLRQVLAIEIEK